MLLVTVLLGQVQTMMALLVQETAFHGYSRRDLTRMLGWGLLECLWYHPLLAIWRTSGTIRLALGRRPGWGEIPREALDEAPARGADATHALTLRRAGIHRRGYAGR